MTPTEMFNFYRASKLASSNFPEDVTRAIQWEVAVKREAWALRRGRNAFFFLWYLHSCAPAGPL